MSRVDKKSMTCLIVILVCFGQLITDVGANMRFILSLTSGQWSEAMQSCQRAQGTLAVLNTKQLQLTFNTQVLTSPRERLWVGRYIGYSDPVWIHGCYGNVSLDMTVQRTLRVLPDNYLITCLNACRQSPYIGMQGDYCYCMGEVPRAVTPVPGIHCQSACPGESVVNSPGQHLSHCGRKDSRYNTVSVYRRARTGEVSLRAEAGNYGECITYDARTASWSPGNCTQSLLYTCDRKPCNDVASRCVLESRQPDTWFGARTKCEGNGGYVATVNTTTNAYFTNRPGPAAAGPYWTGLHRQQKVQWSAGENNPNLSPSDRCLALYKTEAGTWEWEVNPCRNSYRYVCIQDNTSPITTPAPRITPPSRWTPRPQFKTTTATPGPTAKPRPTVNPFAAAVNVTAGVASTHSRGWWSVGVTSLAAAISVLVSMATVIV